MLSLTSGCNTSGCSDNRSALPLAGFYDFTTGNHVILDHIAIGGVNAPNDSMLLQTGESATQIYLPFRANHTTTSYFIEYHLPEAGLRIPEDNDTITFSYFATPYFASEECGAYYKYTITGVHYTKHILRRVEMIDTIATNAERELMRLYFKAELLQSPEPAPGEEPDDSEEDYSGSDSENGTATEGGGQ